MLLPAMLTRHAEPAGAAGAVAAGASDVVAGGAGPPDASGRRTGDALRAPAEQHHLHRGDEQPIRSASALARIGVTAGHPLILDPPTGSPTSG